MGAYMSDEGDNKKNFRAANEALARRIVAKLEACGALVKREPVAVEKDNEKLDK